MSVLPNRLAEYRRFWGVGWHVLQRQYMYNETVLQTTSKKVHVQVPQAKRRMALRTPFLASETSMLQGTSAEQHGGAAPTGRPPSSAARVLAL